MASVNKVILLGNLGRDPETRYTTGGDAVTNLNIATSEQWKDKSGEKQERTEWHRVVLFGRQAEVAGEYLKKGRSCFSPLLSFHCSLVAMFKFVTASPPVV